MFRNASYWYRFHPIYKLVPEGNIKVIEVSGKYTRYKIALDILLSCWNQDDLEGLALNCENILVKLKSTENIGRKKAYNLSYHCGEPIWYILPSGKIENKKYELVGWSDIFPKLGNVVLCKPINAGNVFLRGINKTLKVKSFKLDVERIIDGEV